MSDDPLDDALAAKASGQTDSSDPLDAALAQRAAGQGPPPVPTPKQKTSLGMSAVHAGADIIGGMAHAAGNLVDIATGTSPGPGSYAERFSGPFQHEPDYEGDYVDPKEQARRALPKINPYDILPQGPFRETVEERLPQAAEGIGTVLTLGGIAKGLAENAAPAEIEQGHPLTQAAQNEAAEMDTYAKAAEDAGVKLPPREVTPAQQYVDNAARRDLNLPKNAPVTSGLLEQARKTYVQPAYEAAKAVPEYELGPAYQNAINGVDLSKIEPELRPPVSGTMSGEEAVRLSQSLRHEANAWYDYADGAGGPAAKATAKAYRDAYKAVEAGFKEGADPAVAKAWTDARTYAAKTYAWEDSLDGAGHAAGPKIRKLLQTGEPISGPMKEAASVVAQYPELFRSTRLATPAPGLARRGAAALSPMAGAGVGGWLGGPGGAMVGEHVGRMVGDKLISR